MKLVNKIKDSVSISFLLAAIVILSSFSSRAKAEFTEKILLNEHYSTINNIRFEKVDTLPCTTNACFKRPNDAVISNDGSFILIAESQNPISLRKFNFSSGSFTDTLTIPLAQKNSLISPLLNISLSPDNSKALIYREPTEGEDTLVQIVDLISNTSKELSSINSTNLSVSMPVFLTPDGKKIIAGTLDDLSSPELIIVDVDSDSISNRISLFDEVQSVHVSPNLKQAVITYSSDLSQSVSIYNIANNSLSTLSLDEDFGFAVDDFLDRIDFDLSGNKATLSSFGGIHVLYYVDLLNNKLIPSILDKSQDGPTISTISPDGKTIISVGGVFKKSTGFKVYKSIIGNDNSISQSTSSTFLDESIALDVDISPDQNKIYILELKNGLKQLKILSYKDLSQIGEVAISSDNAQSFLTIDPFGRYAITPNTNTEASVSIISDLNSGPILKSILPNTGSINGDTSYTINGFIDLSRFSSDVKVCFKGGSICSPSTNISRTGQTITGITPKTTQTGLSDITLIAKSITGSSLSSSKYEDLFQFVKDASSISDTFPPEITVLAPKDSTAYNTKRIRVLGKVDGTGSQVSSVLVNSNNATLTTDTTSASNIVNFSSEIELSTNGPAQITITAKDKANNTSEKTIQVILDTILPTISANIESNGTQFKISGTANGTGTNISSITVNSTPATFTESENVNFSATVNSIPVNIVVVDKAGNKNQVQISSPTLADTTPPVINITNPSNGQIFKDSSITALAFTVTDNSSVNTVTVNGKALSVSANNQYSQNLTLKPGENLISIIASDSAENKSTTNIKVSYAPPVSGSSGGGSSTSDFQNTKEVITLPSSFDNLNNALIEGLTDTNGNIINVGNTSSIELANPPPIPDGEPATIEPPKVEGITTDPDQTLIPKGFSFASGVTFNNENGSVITVDNGQTLYTVVLTDSTGRTFIVGFAFLKTIDDTTSTREFYKFQTTNGTPLDLITTLTVPSDANEGNANVSIISNNDSLASIALNITPPPEVKVKNKSISRPQMKEPILSEIKNNGTKLKLTITGKNFIGRVATIDGKLQKLFGKGTFFTNVTFVPSDGITITNIKVTKKKLLLNANIDSSNITPGVKLFNIITPKGADIGGIVFPEVIQDGKLEATTTPENLLLENTQ